jgi:formamidopyrimidine-DNA glycosylase
MDHTLVAGVGNIYASEALFDCGIDPRAQALDCAQQAAALIASIRAVLRAALASGGSSLRDFFDSNGDPGRFQHHFKVYDREGKPCYACVTPVARLAQGGRSTFFCPSCQQGPQNRAGKAAKGRKTRASRP